MFSLEKYQKCNRNKKQKWNHAAHRKYLKSRFWILFRNCKHFIIFPFMTFFLHQNRQWRHRFHFTASLNGIGMMGGCGIWTTCISDEIMTPWGDYVVTVFFIKDFYTREFKLSPSSFQIKEISKPKPQIHCLPILNSICLGCIQGDFRPQ